MRDDADEQEAGSGGDDDGDTFEVAETAVGGSAAREWMAMAKDQSTVLACPSSFWRFALRRVSAWRAVVWCSDGPFTSAPVRSTEVSDKEALALMELLFTLSWRKLETAAVHPVV